jgi:hypothetical protein
MITHPQMLLAHHMMLGEENIRFIHVTILACKEGYVGQGSHGHDYYKADHFTWREGEGYVHLGSSDGMRAAEPRRSVNPKERG